MGILATATRFNELIHLAYATKGKVSDNYDIQLLIELLRKNASDTRCYHGRKYVAETLLNSINDKLFVRHLESLIQDKNYLFLPSGVDKTDSICLCKLTLANGFKVIGSFTGQRHQYPDTEMEEKAYQDALNKLKPLEEYSLMSTLKDINQNLDNLKMMKGCIEQTLISLIIGKSPNLRITF